MRIGIGETDFLAAGTHIVNILRVCQCSLFADLMHFINWMLCTYSFTYTYTCDSYLFFRYLSDCRDINLYLYLRNRYADMDRYDALSRTVHSLKGPKRNTNTNFLGTKNMNI